MTEEETLQLKRLLTNYFSKLLNEEIEKVVSSKGYTQKDFDNMLNEKS